MTESAFLDRLRQRRDDLLRRIVDVLRRDERVRAAWLGGSFGRGTADGWSDLDLYSAIDDEHLACWLAERGDLLHRASEPLQIGPPGPGFTLAEGVFQSVLFAGPVQVDWEVAPASVAVRHPDTLVLLERESIPVRVPARLDEHECQSRIEGEMGFFWAMALIALKYVGRRDTQRAVTQIDLLGEIWVRLWRLFHDLDRLDAGGARWRHSRADAELNRRSPLPGPHIGPDSALVVIGRLIAEVERLHPAIEQLGVTIPVDVVREVERFRDALTRHLISNPVHAGR